MEIIAKQGEANRYLLSFGETGRIADLDENLLFKVRPIGSILKSGYWEDFDHDDKLMEKLLSLPEYKDET